MHCMYVASICLNFHPSTYKEWNAQNMIWSLTFVPWSLVIWSHVFWPSITWTLRKAQHRSKSVLTIDCCRPHLQTFGYYYWLVSKKYLTKKNCLQRQKGMKKGTCLAYSNSHSSESGYESTNDANISTVSSLSWKSQKIRVREGFR